MPYGNNLILITNHFPYGRAEAFLENEIDHLTKGFDQVIILAKDVTSPDLRKLTGSFITHRINPKSDLTEKIVTGLLFLVRWKTSLAYIKTEVRYLKKNGQPVNRKIWARLLHDLGKAHITAYHIDRIITSHQLKGKVTLYSYWLTSSALATTMVKSRHLQIKCASRAHGGDIYEFRHQHHYISFRNVLAQKLDKIFTISNDGASHLRKNIEQSLHNKIQVSRLGTRYAGASPLKNNAHEFTLVSCAFMIGVKRIHLIVQALSLIDSINIKWVHIGDGELKADIEQLIDQKFSGKKNVKCNLMGALSNRELLKFYQENYVDLFINTSSSEGIPVTMMEAQSFGIPILAPDVGGVGEIVSPENGRLFSANASASEIAGAIQSILSLPPTIYQALRTHAFRNWESRYNAQRNFSTFVAEMRNL
ncbi:MAG: glycosyltransferase [Bacteroidota bacterium]